LDTLPTPRSVLIHHGLRAALIAQAVVGSVFGLASAIVIPAFQFRLEASADAMTFVLIALAVTFLAALEAALVAVWSATRGPRAGAIPLRVVRRRELVFAFLLPVACTVFAARARTELLEREDPLLGYVERGLAHAWAQPGIGSQADLVVDEGRLTLIVPTYMARRARWWVDVDASDTEGRFCSFHKGVMFGDEPVVLHVPVPLESEDRSAGRFTLIPGSMVVVRAIRLTLDPRDPSLKRGQLAVYTREFDLVYEVPALARGARMQADFVGAQR